MYGERFGRCNQSNKTSIINAMSFEELLQEHIKALNENTEAIKAYTKAINNNANTIDVEHTKDSAQKFCGVTYKTLQMYLESGLLPSHRRKNGIREYFKEKDLIALCEAQNLYAGEYGTMKKRAVTA